MTLGNVLDFGDHQGMSTPCIGENVITSISSTWNTNNNFLLINNEFMFFDT